MILLPVFQGCSLDLFSNIHSIIPLLSFLSDTIKKLARKISETSTRMAALISLISRLPSEMVGKMKLFILWFRFCLPWGLSREGTTSFRLDKAAFQTAVA